MRGLTWSEYDEPKNSGFFPFTLTLSPGENVSSWQINCGGEGTIAIKSTASFLTALSIMIGSRCRSTVTSH